MPWRQAIEGPPGVAWSAPKLMAPTYGRTTGRSLRRFARVSMPGEETRLPGQSLEAELCRLAPRLLRRRPQQGCPRGNRGTLGRCTRTGCRTAGLNHVGFSSGATCSDYQGCTNPERLLDRHKASQARPRSGEKRVVGSVFKGKLEIGGQAPVNRRVGGVNLFACRHLRLRPSFAHRLED